MVAPILNHQKYCKNIIDSQPIWILLIPVPDDSNYVKTSPVLLGPWRTDLGGG